MMTNLPITFPAPGDAAGIAPPPTITERADMGAASGWASDVAVVPFPDAWSLNDLFYGLPGPLATMIATKLNDGWSLTFHRYRDERGRAVFVVLRMDHPTGAERKLIRPLRVQRMIGICAKIVFGALPGLRPLYALDQIVARPDAPILIVEGEKTADAGVELFPDHVVTTWPGGADGIGRVDLRPLRGRTVVIWPDNDESGHSAANKLARAAKAAGAASVAEVHVPSYFPKKWDIADPLPEGARA